MRVKHLVLAAVAVFATVMPARADVVLSYHLSPFLGPAGTIPNNSALGPQLANLLMNVGDVRYVQVAIEGTAAGITPAQTAWDSGNGLISFGFALNYPTAIVQQVFITPTPPTLNQNFPNARSQGPYATGHPNTFVGYNMGATAITGLDLGTGLEAAAGILPKTVIATFRINATTAGIGNLTITELNSAPTSSEFGLLDLTNLDPIIFAAAHAGFPLAVTVVDVPEPTSLALVGMAVAGLGWRKLRRKKEVAA